MMTTNLLVMLMLLPLAGAVVISRCGRWPNIREAITLGTAALTFVVACLLYQGLETGSQTLVIAQPLEALSIAFSVTRFGVLFALLASGLWLVTSVYAIGYMRGHHEKNQTRFYVLFAVAIATVMAIAFSDNLLTLFLFYEVLTVSTYPLVTHAGTEEARKGGKQYLMILMGSSIVFFLPAIIITYMAAGTLTFQEGGILQGHLDPAWLVPLMLLFIFGISKAGVMPLHRWLPSAMVAPTPVSALLHAVAVVKAGVFSLLKVVLFVAGPEFLQTSDLTQYLLIIPMATIITASLVAMTRDNLKERLAYSTVSQLSYIVLGALLLTPAGLLGGTMHIVMHATAKITLFFAAGAVLVATHKTNISQMNGLGRAMPVTFGLFTVGAMSIIGIPFFSGMWSKWYLVTGAVAFQGNPVLQWSLSITLMLSTLLNIWYLLSIPMHAFFKSGDDARQYREAPLACLIGMAVPAALCVYLFFDPHVIFNLAAHITGGSQP